MKKRFSLFSLLEILVILLLILYVGANALGYRFYTVMSGSMLPTIPVGSIALVNTNETNYEIGDIITYNRNGEVITHRIHDVQGEDIFTKGDANQSVDAATILHQNIIGKYLFFIPVLGYLFVYLRQYFLYVLTFIAVICLLFLIFKKNGGKENE